MQLVNQVGEVLATDSIHKLAVSAEGAIRVFSVVRGDILAPSCINLVCAPHRWWEICWTRKTCG